jgi:hypothetical protein
MADLFLHLTFARRLRRSVGLHPLAGEAMGRRPALVVLGASLAALPAREHAGMSWFRRLVSGGGEAARWEKLLQPAPSSSELVTSILRSDDAAVGPMARLALGAGLLAHDLLEQAVGSLTTSLAAPQRAAVERAQARLWLQTLDASTLVGEWRPALDFADADAHKRTLAHLERALARVHGGGPGDAALGRWLKALAAEVAPLIAPQAEPLPPSLSVADADARAAHFDQVGLVDKVKAAADAFVGYANRLAEVFQQGSPDHAATAQALAKLDDVKATADVDARRLRWTAWLTETHEATRVRGRNPKPAFAEGEDQPSAAGDQHLASSTKAMSLADLPPEPADSGLPPSPELVSAAPAVPAPPAGAEHGPPAQASAEPVGAPPPSSPAAPLPSSTSPGPAPVTHHVVEDTAPGRLGPPVSIAPEDVMEIPPEPVPHGAPDAAPATGGNGVGHEALPEPGPATEAAETEPPRE